MGTSYGILYSLLLILVLLSHQARLIFRSHNHMEYSNGNCEDNLHYLFMFAHEVRLEIFEMLAQEVRLAVDDFCSVVTKDHKLLITINLNYSLCR